MKFKGRLKLRIGEAVDLKPTTYSLRHSVVFNKAPPSLDPYIVIKVDDFKVGQTHTKQKTNTPTYNEDFSVDVNEGKRMELAVFHETPIGYDDFVANCSIQFEDLIETSNTEESFEKWVSISNADGSLHLGTAQCYQLGHPSYMSVYLSIRLGYLSSLLMSTQLSLIP